MYPDTYFYRWINWKQIYGSWIEAESTEERVL
jgi:hypothetical protein